MAEYYLYVWCRNIFSCSFFDETDAFFAQSWGYFQIRTSGFKKVVLVKNSIGGWMLIQKQFW
jgi:hypothetical protein